MTGILSALAKVRFGTIGADAENTHFGNRYATLSKVLEIVKPELMRVGLHIMQPLTHVSGVPAVKTILFNEKGETLEFEYPLVGVQRADPQGYASAVTYARRYSILSLLSLGVGDDDGEAAVQADPEQVRRMTKAFKELGVSEAQLKNYLGRPLKDCLGTDINRLADIYVELKEKRAEVGDYFKARGEGAQNLNERFLSGKKEAVREPGKS